MRTADVDEDSVKFLSTDSTDCLLDELVLMIGADPLGVEESNNAVPG